jgi:predicted DNA-binding transcriptional regulator AlpA
MAETGHDLMGMREVCQLFGGAKKPIDPSTLYRGMKSGRFPKPIKFSRNMVRWRRGECEAALQKIIDAHERETGT